MSIKNYSLVLCITYLLMHCNAKISITVAGAQVPVSTNMSQNVEHIKWAISIASQQNVDYLVTPEGSLSGYYSEYNQTEVNYYLSDIVSYAASKHIGLILGTCFDEIDKNNNAHKYDQQRFYDQKGNYIGFYAKQLLTSSLQYPGSGEAHDFIAGKSKGFDLPLLNYNKTIRVGGLICNDMWAFPACSPYDDPHLSHVLASQFGVEIIFHSVNPGPGNVEMILPFQTSNLQLRAQADNIYIVTVSPVAVQGQNCYSGVVANNGSWLVKSDLGKQDVFIWTIELE
eukprot:17791_1